MASRGRYARGEHRRTEILEATTRMLGEDGYRATSVRAIARELRIDPANLLYYFKSREGLLEEVIKSWDQKFVDLAAAAGHTEFDIDWWVRTTPNNLEVPGLIRLFVIFSAESAEKEHPSHEFMKARVAQLEAAIIKDLQRRQLAGRIAEAADLPKIAQSLIALADGLELYWLGHRDSDFAGLFRSGVDAILAAARPDRFQEA